MYSARALGRSARSKASSWGRTEAAGAQARKHRERDARPDAADFQQLPEGAALRLGAEAVEQMRILAHDEVGEQGDALAGCGQVVESAHRHLDLVADSARFHHDLRRVFLEKDAGEPPDHTSLPLFTRNPRVGIAPRPCPPCAWQMAQASASAASAEGAPASPRSRFTISCTCPFFAWPLPTTACLTWSAVYSDRKS